MLFFLRSISQFFTQIYMNCFFQFISWTNWVDSGKFMDNCWISCQVMADVEKFYNDLIIINLYIKVPFFLNARQKLGKFFRCFSENFGRKLPDLYYIFTRYFFSFICYFLIQVTERLVFCFTKIVLTYCEKKMF